MGKTPQFMACSATSEVPYTRHSSRPRDIISAHLVAFVIPKCGEKRWMTDDGKSGATQHSLIGAFAIESTLYPFQDRPSEL